MASALTSYTSPNSKSPVSITSLPLFGFSSKYIISLPTLLTNSTPISLKLLSYTTFNLPCNKLFMRIYRIVLVMSRWLVSNIVLTFMPRLKDKFPSSRVYRTSSPLVYSMIILSNINPTKSEKL